MMTSSFIFCCTQTTEASNILQINKLDPHKTDFVERPCNILQCFVMLCNVKKCCVMQCNVM